MGDATQALTSSSDRPDRPRDAAVGGGPSRRLSTSLLALSLLVLGSNAFYVIGLMASGVTWTDGNAAYGVTGGDVSRFLPPGLSHLIGGVVGIAFLLGPVLVVPMALGAAVLVLRSWRRSSTVDLPAVAALVASAVLGVLLGAWGDELWVWALD